MGTLEKEICYQNCKEGYVLLELNYATLVLDTCIYKALSFYSVELRMRPRTMFHLSQLSDY